jgi:VanZ family protein
MIKKIFTTICFILTICAAIIIFYISSLSFHPGSGSTSSYLSEAYHFLAFFWLAFLLQLSLITKKENRRLYLFLAVIFCLIYAASDEMHQLFVPGRCCDFYDFLTDSAGIVLAVILNLFISYKAR